MFNNKRYFYFKLKRTYFEIFSVQVQSTLDQDLVLKYRYNGRNKNNYIVTKFIRLKKFLINANANIICYFGKLNFFFQNLFFWKLMFFRVPTFGSLSYDEKSFLGAYRISNLLALVFIVLEICLVWYTFSKKRFFFVLKGVSRNTSAVV